MAVYGNTTVMNKIEILENFLFESERTLSSYTYNLNESVIVTEGAKEKVKEVISKIKEHWRKFVTWFKEKIALLKSKIIKKVAKAPGLNKIKITKKLKVPSFDNNDMIDLEKSIIETVTSFANSFPTNLQDKEGLKKLEEFLDKIKEDERLKDIEENCISEKSYKGNYDQIYDEYSKIHDNIEKGVKNHDAIIVEIEKLNPKIEKMIDYYQKQADTIFKNAVKTYTDKDINTDFDLDKGVKELNTQSLLYYIINMLNKCIQSLTRVSKLSSNFILEYKKAQAYNAKAIAYISEIKDEDNK